MNKNVCNNLKKALHPLRGMMALEPEANITVLPPALLAKQEIPTAEHTAEEATLSVEIAFPNHVQIDSSSDEGQSQNNV